MEWIAIYNDKTELKQFENGKEHLFKEINQEKLRRFALTENNKIQAFVDLDTGQIHIGDQILEFPKFKDVQFRLIYFRRVKQVLGLPEQSSVNHHIGWQTTIGDRNYKRIITFKDNKIAITCD